MPAERALLRPRALMLGLAAVLCLVVGVALPTGAQSQVPSAGVAHTSSLPNLILILTDDQRWDELGNTHGVQYMPTVQSQLMDKGIHFTNAFVVNPSCCPSRTTILTGKYSHGTDVYTNKPPHGGFQTFEPEEGSTLATWLQTAGYYTGLVGKYLNGYDASQVAHVPPGWNRWVGLTLGSNEGGPVGYYDYTLSVDGKPVPYGSGLKNYSTNVLGGYATDFIEKAPSAKPLFLYFAPYSPHSPTQVAKNEKSSCAGLQPLRPPSFNEANTSDKPKYEARRSLLTQSDIAKIDQHHLRDCQTLMSADDQVNAILTALQDTGRLSNSLIVFMSDNGYLFGEHRRTGKIVPYEESIRVAMVVRDDGVIPSNLKGTTNADLVLNLDIASTFAAAAGVSSPGAVGMNFLPLLTNPGAAWRDHFLIEHWGEGGVPAYCAIRTADWKFVRYSTGEQELYDLAADPYELQNQASNPASPYPAEVAAMRAIEQNMCQPPPPGFTP